MKSFFSPCFARQRQRPRARRRRGVAVVEAALCLIFVLLPVTMGGFQFALVFMTQHALQQIAREGARFAAVRYSEATFNSDENQGNAANASRSLKNVIRRQAAANGIDWNDINGTVSPDGLSGSIVVTPAPQARVSGQPITITVTYPMKRRAFLGSLFFKDEKTNTVSLMSLGFLDNNFSASSTILME